MRSMQRLLALSAVAVLVLTPQPASAHAELASSDPRDGATLSAMPTEVVLELSEEVKKPAFVVITDDDGRRLSSGPVRVDGRKVSNEVFEPTKSGAFTITYRIVSADAHAVSGTVKFSVGGGSASPSPSTTPSASPEGTKSISGESVQAESRDTLSDTAAIAFILLALIVMTGLSVLILLRITGRSGGD